LDWTLLALLSAGTFGVVTAFDKRLIDKHLPSLASFYAAVCITLVGSAAVVLAASGGPESAPTGNLIMAGVSGLCWSAGLAMTFWGYKLEEASRASAVIHVFPVFVAIMAVGFLDETLAAGQWVAILVVVTGAMLVSLRSSARSGLGRLTRSFPVLIGAGFFLALAHLTGKYALEEVSVSTFFPIRSIVMAIGFFLLAKPRAFRQLLVAMRDRQTLVLVVAAEFILAPVGSLTLAGATSLGPVSLVSTMSATRPLFVFVITTLLSAPRIRILEEPLERNTLALKLVSLGLILSGTAALTLL
tara:strand:- start:515 stop:1417 length:903 start_codon:yes stop_codon:yes gene_type:complete